MALFSEMMDEACAKDREIARLRGQLPEGLQECTILFRECLVGHGRLTATNWIDHGCPWCKIEQLRQVVSSIDSEVLLPGHLKDMADEALNMVDDALGPEAVADGQTQSGENE